MWLGPWYFVDAQIDERGTLPPRRRRGPRSRFTCTTMPVMRCGLEFPRTLPCGIFLTWSWGCSTGTRPRSPLSLQVPVLLVSARAENGEPIGRFEPKIKYRPGQVAGGGVVRDGKPAGDVDMVRQADGRWGADQLLPDEEFMLIVEADGYQPRAERLSLPEGAVREMQVRLEKTASRAPPGSALGAAKTDHPAGDPPAEEALRVGFRAATRVPPQGCSAARQRHQRRRKACAGSSPKGRQEAGRRAPQPL